MKSLTISKSFGIAAVITLATAVVWGATGGDFYTKYQIVETIESEVDANDPLVAVGFYEGTTQTQTVTRNEFHLGLLPTPQGIFDKHALSVASIAGPTWVAAISFAWWTRRRVLRT